jgi:murein DD-endopeptidase MepM/ murein hydrolase activator NlpD
MNGQPGRIADDGTRLRTSVRSRAAVGVAIGMFSLAAALAVAPPDSSPPPTTRVTSTEIELASAVVVDRPAAVWTDERVARGESWIATGARLGLAPAAARAFAEQAGATLPPPRQGVTMRVLRDADGSLRELRVAADERTAVVTRQHADYVAASEPRAATTRIELRSAVIDRSLFAATDDAGIPDAIASRLAEVFAGEIDFLRDLRRGDHFSVLYEVRAREGEADQPGRMLAAEFVASGRNLTAILFEAPGAAPAWYTADGRNLRRAFLRSPMEFSRISSGFSEARMHPILQTMRAHKGIDYAAPVGTRVLATSDGQILFAGWRSGYGNVVELRHRNGVTTLYGHLSGFGPQVRTGNRIAQSDVVGYVGATGLATGPHLHYEFRSGGVHVDPLRHVPEAGPAVAAAERPRFASVASERLARLALVRGAKVAALE